MQKGKAKIKKQTIYRKVPIGYQKLDNSLPKKGVFHPIHHISNYFNCNFRNDFEINGFQLSDGWLYKDINKIMEETKIGENYTNPIANKYPAHITELDLIYNLLFEKIFEEDVNLKVKYVRTFLAEINRIISHLNWFHGLAYILHLKADKNRFKKIIADFLFLLQKYLEILPQNTRINYGMAPNIKSSTAGVYSSILLKKKDKILNYMKIFVNKTVVRNNLIGLGIISKKQALTSRVVHDQFL